MDILLSIHPWWMSTTDADDVHTVAQKELGHHVVTLNLGAGRQWASATTAKQLPVATLLHLSCLVPPCTQARSVGGARESALSALLLQSGGMFFCKTAMAIFKQASHSYGGQLT